MFEETIAAIATAPGKGGIGIIRLSGVNAVNIARSLISSVPPVQTAKIRQFRAANGEIIDQGLVLFFSKPDSFTGEDVIEFHAHGGPVVLDMLLSRLLEAGARLARPGEFSERAFLNDRLDLAQAEAIADLIDATSTHAVIAAQRSLQGEFSVKVQDLLEQLIALRVYVEAAIDFPEEEIDFLSDGRIKAKLSALLQALENVLAVAGQGSILREGMQLVLAGLPNAGKSSLLNGLSGMETAIVTDQPGTTRDVLSREINLDGMPVHVIDTAGLRESDDIVEQEGVRRAWNEINQAHRILYIVDNQSGVQEKDLQILAQLPEQIEVTLVYNKIDLGQDTAELEQYTQGFKKRGSITHGIRLSAKTKNGIELLKSHLKEVMGYNATQEGVFLARRRHISALEKTLELIVHGEQQLQLYAAGELLAADLAEAQKHLSSVTGEFTSDDLLGEIFSNFCIGK